MNTEKGNIQRGALSCFKRKKIARAIHEFMIIIMKTSWGGMKKIIAAAAKKNTKEKPRPWSGFYCAVMPGWEKAFPAGRSYTSQVCE